MNLYKVDFTYQETGYIPNIVAETEEAAVEGAKLLLEQQGVKGTVTTVTNLSQKQDEDSVEAAKAEGTLN